MTPRKIAIIGGGPIGIEAALYARTLGHEQVVVYERGDVAQSVKSWGFVRLFSPWEMNATTLGWKAIGQASPRGTNPTGDELRDCYLLPLAVSRALQPCLRPHTTVTSASAFPCSLMYRA